MSIVPRSSGALALVKRDASWPVIPRSKLGRLREGLSTALVRAPSSSVDSRSVQSRRGGLRAGPVGAAYNRREGVRPQFERPPLSLVKGIPVFSEFDTYITNYEKIARDHLSSLTSSGVNPFMEEQLWSNLEETTRSLVRKHTRPGDIILDVGVGLGRLSQGVPDRVWHGIDISHEYLEKAAEKGIAVALSRIEDMPYEDACFDAVVCTDVLEHVLDLNYCTGQILRVLKPGGVAIIRVPLNDYLDVYLENQSYEFVHLRRFDLASLRLHFEKIFNCVYIEHAESQPAYRGAHTLKVRSLPYGSPANDIIASNPEELGFLNSFLAITDEQLSNAMANLEVNQPELFKKLEPHLVTSLEMNAVFISRGMPAPRRSRPGMEG